MISYLKMDVEKTLERLGIEVDSETLDACLFLESMGLRFCIDFGTENAITKADCLRAFASCSPFGLRRDRTQQFYLPTCRPRGSGRY